MNSATHELEHRSPAASSPREKALDTPDTLSSWYLATTLEERLEALRGATGTFHQSDPERATRRLERWRAQLSFDTDDRWREHLKRLGISETELRHLLGASAEELEKMFASPPAWLVALLESFSLDTAPAAPQGAMQPRPGTSGFLDLIEPLLQRARQRCEKGCRAVAEAFPAAPIEPVRAAALVLRDLPAQLHQMLSRTLVLEMHVARLQGRLEGETPRARFESFVASLRQRGIACDLLQEYPVLARQVHARIEQALDAGLELLHRLCADWAEIRSVFDLGAEPGILTDLNPSAGDRHRRGRTVMILTFASGARLVYKPKSLAIDVHFQQLLAWVNARGEHPPFHQLQVLDRGAYGWVEFATATACPSRAGVRRFYQRQGGYLALLWALQATDFHFENLIAVGEHPVLIDLEALFHPCLEHPGIGQVGERAGQALSDSVLRVGLLPRRIWGGANADGLDISGLGAPPGQVTPHRVPQWESAGTDEMVFARKRVTMLAAQNRPALPDGSAIDLLDYGDALEEGFRKVYRVLLTHRQELLSAAGPLRRCAADEVRAILRPTRTYGSLLLESFHPNILRDALDRRRHFELLWAGGGSVPGMERAIPFEMADLWRADIPIFTTRPDSLDLWTSDGACFAGFFAESGLSQVERRLAGLSEGDLTRQLWFIRASLAAMDRGEGRVRSPSSQLTGSPPQADRAAFLAAARAVGDRLEALAFRGDGDVAWVGLAVIDESRWLLAPLGLDLYGGLPGVALFLAHLGEILAEERYTRLAKTTLAVTRERLDEVAPHLTSIGGFEGWGGLIYSFTHLGLLWDEPQLLSEAEAMAERLPELIAGDEAFDVIAGTAGGLMSLLRLHAHAPSQQLLETAVRCGEHLLAGAQEMAVGRAWPCRFSPDQPLTGFSHGAAGIAWALLELATASGEARFRDAAREAIRYERSLFSPEAGNWPDLRTPEDQQPASEADAKFMTAWCHGAPGIGLARLLALPGLEEPALVTELEAAVETTLRQGFGGSHCLCHGDLGNLDFLLQAREVVGEEALRSSLDAVAAAILAGIQRQGWVCGVPLEVETPGLMTGLAGIGYGLLRWARPDIVPSVLTMGLPSAPRSAG